jgi:hypothetical protein
MACRREKATISAIAGNGSGGTCAILSRDNKPQEPSLRKVELRAGCNRNWWAVKKDL